MKADLWTQATDTLDLIDDTAEKTTLNSKLLDAILLAANIQGNLFK